MQAAAHRSMTIRVNPSLYERAGKLAKRRRQSLNALISESLEKTLLDDEEQQLFADAELLGQFPDESSVEYAYAAQAEVALREPYEDS